MQVSFSVVLPVRDGVRWIADALDGVSAQSSPPVECIVLDDGSSDASIEVVGRWSARQTFPVRLARPPQPPAGVANCRNLAVSLANGTWIAFLDQDDVWAPSKLAEQRAYIERQPAAAVVGCVPRLLFEGVEPVPFVEAWARMIEELVERTGDAPCLGDLLTGCPFCLSGVVASRSALLEAGGFDPSCPPVSDWLMWAHLAMRAPVALLPRQLVTYRVHSSNQLFGTSRHPLGVTSGFLQVRSRIMDRVARERGIPTQDAAAIVDGLIRAAVRGRRKDGRFRTAAAPVRVRGADA